MISTHTYAAVLIGAPDKPLSVKGGSITLDASHAPHVQGTLTIAVPSLATLNALDPRNTPRIRVTATSDLAGGQTRVFNLGLRSRAVSHSAGTLTLPLASDEALLGDYAPLADDLTPRTYEASLRSVVNYVLGVVLPGTTLAASPANNADVTAYWSVTNEMPNPGGEVNTAGWTAAVNCTVFSQDAGVFAGSKAIGVTTNAAGGLAFLAMDPNRRQSVRPGELKTFRAAFKSNYASGRTARFSLRWYNSQGDVIGADTLGPLHTPTSIGWTDGLYVTGTAPEGAASVLVIVTVTGSTGPGQGYYVDSAALYTGDYQGYFDGNTPATAQYTYAWTGTANASTSTRKAIFERLPEALTWKAGQSALDFLLPLVQSVGLRLVCDEARVWTLRNENYSAPGALSIRHGVNLIDGTDTISRDTALWFDAQVTRYTWDDASGATQTRIDAYALNTPYTRLNTVDIRAAYPGPGRSQYAVRRAQGRGREVSATTVADWTARAEQPITVILENAPTQIGQTTAVTFNLDDDTMQVTTRTTDTPLGAIDLLVGTIDSLTGTIDIL